MFELLQAAPPDAILGITDAFRKDPNPNKINLSVGVYKDEHGQTPVLASVKKAEERLLASETNKGYLPINGAAEYGAAVRNLLFGADHEIIASDRAVTAHTPGGTGALRVAADFFANNFPGQSVWLSEPTWPNHPSIFQAAGIEVKTYPYLNESKTGLDFEAMLQEVRHIPEGDMLLLHGCCHNPTGVDPTPEQWAQLAEVIERRGILPLVDFAYQGFGDGLAEDVQGLLQLAQPGIEMFIATSYSKNFSLYNERVGALTLVANDANAAKTALSRILVAIRSNYSNPPAHGGLIVKTILEDEALTAEWHAELAGMRNRINGMRKLFVDTMAKKAPSFDCSFIAQQRGMFSLSGLTKAHVEALRDEHAVYIVGSGRINVAGMTEDNMEALCDAIAAVIA